MGTSASSSSSLNNSNGNNNNNNNNGVGGGNTPNTRRSVVERNQTSNSNNNNNNNNNNSAGNASSPSTIVTTTALPKPSAARAIANMVSSRISGSGASSPSHRLQSGAAGSPRNSNINNNHTTTLRRGDSSDQQRNVGGEGEDRSHDSSISANSEDTDRTALWCYVKAKTRQHDSSKVLRRTLWFQAKEGASLKIGRGEECGLRLEDDRCAPVNAQVLGVSPERNTVRIHPEARMYQLIGMGLKRGNTAVPLAIGSVIKIGSVSLEVTALCTEEGDSLIERFGTEIKASVNRRTQNVSTLASSSESKKSKKRDESLARATPPIQQNSTSSSSENLDAASTVSTAVAGGPGVSENNETVEGVTSPTPTSVIMKVEGEKVLETGTLDEFPSEKEEEEDEPIGAGKPLHLLADVVDPKDEMCYICWGGPTEEDLRGDLKNTNPLIRNPCGKCSGSSRYVHLECILKWIKSSGSGHCSICNGALPQHFASPPPNLELKVVRHRRGQSWVGTRRFRLSFAEKSYANIGRDSDCDVKLGDRSVFGTHARISFDKATRTFMLQDCASSSGTFLQVNEDISLVPNITTYLKIGRTIISIRVSERRKSLRDYLPRISRALSR